MINGIDYTVFSWFSPYTVVFAQDADTAMFLFEKEKKENPTLAYPFLRIWRSEMVKVPVSPAMYREGGIAGYTDDTQSTIRTLKAIPVDIAYEVEVNGTEVNSINEVLLDLLFKLHQPRSSTVRLDVGGVEVDLPVYPKLADSTSLSIELAGSLREQGHLFRGAFQFPVGSFLVLADEVKAVLDPVVNIVINYDF